MNRPTTPTSIVIIGASGDLARKKLIPALFHLFCNGFLPERFRVVGFARTPLDDESFRQEVAETLTTRFQPEPGECALAVGHFLKRCHYHQGQYTRADDFRTLGRRIEGLAGPRSGLLLYMAIPPDVFLDTARSIRAAGLADEEERPWSRVVIEKPFGRDTASSSELTRALGKIFSENQTYRIDHYLGKEAIQNLLALRFGNRILEPLWNREHIESVEICFSEDIGTQGRAGYFDRFGIIRDVVQNHLLQALALVAMEQPIRLTPGEIAREKDRVLRATRPMNAASTLVGQYEGYRQEPGVPEDSITETFVRTTLHVDTPRWYGVPFEITAGKALAERKTEILVRFRDLPVAFFPGAATNTLRIRIQPDEEIELQLNNKVPGMNMTVTPVGLNMLYQQEFATALPEAYERLLLDVLRGDRSLFIQQEELAAAWEVVTPYLQERERLLKRPPEYPYGCQAPHIFLRSDETPYPGEEAPEATPPGTRPLRKERIRSFPTKESARTELQAELHCALVRKNPQVIMLAGGSTPLEIYTALAEASPRGELETTGFILSDDRHVPRNDERSNVGAIFPLISRWGPARPQLLHPDPNLPPEEAALTLSRHIADLARGSSSFELGILGIGSDGHTASLFDPALVPLLSPEEIGLGRIPLRFLEEETPLALAAGIRLGVERVSLTAPVLLAFRRLIFLVLGEEKRDIITRIVQAPRETPAGRVLMQHPQAQIWTDITLTDGGSHGSH
ncbi:glucose-6-phosphate dehydrogenase [Alkalispirochaeta americana]|uniref:glucose-6-phosphate dehydrogenase n=1 Tax=Alkalispirochaeta americana TaxID=159291 RepID=UPI0013564B2A|nr:glucose-6-phosphate dehydrogenase [Alkalispirochaeta americana]